MQRPRTLVPTTLMCSLLAVVPTSAANSPQFRGPTRDGIYPESGLAGQWPEAGPKRLWAAKGLGESYASLTVSTPMTFRPSSSNSLATREPMKPAAPVSKIAI